MGFNSTFAVEEPMEGVEGPSAVSSLSDMSVIMAPPGRTRSVSPGGGVSPIKAGMGMVSPRPTRHTPSPIRQSTMLDLKAPGRGPSPSGIPRRSPRTEAGRPPPPGSGHKARSSSSSRRAGATTPQPVRKAAGKRSLKSSVSVGQLPGLPSKGPAYMQATVSSKTRGHEAKGRPTVPAKENPDTGKAAKGLASSVSNRLDKLKKQVSSNVLRANNKN